MLEIEPVVVDWTVRAYRASYAIAKCDRDLADQLRRSAKSASQNLSEGIGAYGGNKQRAYRIALGEFRESRTSLEIARRLDFTPAATDEERDIEQRIEGTLVKLAYPRSR